MKKLLLTLATVCLLPFAALAAKYEEGKHYEVIAQAATAKPEVKEFFSYYCPHCFQFEPIIKDLKKKLPEGVNLDKVHVNFLPPRKPEQANLLTKALASAQLLKVEEQVSAKIFEAIHVKKQQNFTESGIQGMFAAVGIDEKRFASVFNSFMVNGQVGQMAKAQKEAQIRGVPAVIVNGKYRVLGGVATTEEYIELVNHLTTLK
ncbi:thiol:disulfide interchange protein DsbA/DsbL [Catenovulum sp. SM1970]|uniref:thiol:disulfide interchange protein DsbA/DsbL n=1 Tax=Marinifaba aquimaris TaxID=2741323 RepID=UPI001573D3DD|nr:thiol:disulfide interchange protein DsbA/DsbL [Marinifaba aquimaris]NTS76825.1 thiol:disulfide interchange protein DsbA/DsbL [Marinifaba aquimaris]